MTVVAARHRLARCIGEEAYPCSIVFQLEGCFLLLEAAAVDTVATASVALHDITPLAHKAPHNAMERRPLVVERLPALPSLPAIPSAQAPEILHSLWRLLNAGQH